MTCVAIDLLLETMILIKTINQIIIEAMLFEILEHVQVDQIQRLLVEQQLIDQKMYNRGRPVQPTPGLQPIETLPKDQQQQGLHSEIRLPRDL